MAGRGDQLARRYLAGTACVLMAAALWGPAVTARAQEMSGEPTAMGEVAGNATHAGGVLPAAGDGASLLAAVDGAGPAPFDIRSTRPRLNAPVAARPYPQEPSRSPMPGAGAPGLGSATPGVGPGGLGTGTPVISTPASVTPASVPSPSSSPHPGGVAVSTAPGAGQSVPRHLAELIGTQLPRFAVQANEGQALAEFYASRQYQPVFTAGGGYSPIGLAVQGAFAGAALEGLAAADYAIPALRPNASDAELAETELRLAATTLLYARHAQSGRFDPRKMGSEFIDPSPTVPDPSAVLALVTTSPNARAAMASFAPQYHEYRLLKTQLAARLGDGRAVAGPTVPPGPTLRPGAGDRRVPLLRARLGLQGAADDFTYDPALVEAVVQFQASAGQTADGLVGPGTLAALNGTGADAVADIIANMERWRWVPHEVAPIYVMANIPEYMVRVIVNEQTIHETRVVVGTEKTQTPIMSENLQYMVFNPSWTVPPGIIRRDMLPKLMADPYALERRGIDVIRNGRIIDPGTVNWSRGVQGYSFRQPPGESNAMGRMKFMFPNKHAVYLHDTPGRAAFSQSRRALSNGCVRVHEPLKFAEVIFSLGVKDNWDQKRISRLFGGNEKQVNLQNRFPVHLVYFTTYVDGAGKLVSREDIYGTNAAVKAILGLDGGARVAGRGKARSVQ